MPEERIELSTYPLPRGCATTTLLRHPGPKRYGLGRKDGCYTQAQAKGKGRIPPMAPKDSAAQQRLAAALRENLKRRKAAQRARVAAKSASTENAAEPRPNTAKKPD